ncbi:MAG: aminotransferase class I/II-fold pyridoxal phosphate-dependent enzyme, partial [SAR202 cluster bacterium]|nr:aminotransferase class I/II-fold pyridoxal phosphate-dependent enzyme [SAR202 cluster bacterium]
MIVADSIPIIRPDVLYHEVEHDVRGVLASGILTSGRHVADFEKAVADFVGVDHAVATTSATTALHLSLVALGVEQGDEVLVPDFTFPATANAVIQTGATPVFVDSGIGDFSMDPESAAMHISDRTRVIMPVDPFGQPADHLALARLADDVGARLVV